MPKIRIGRIHSTLAVAVFLAASVSIVARASNYLSSHSTVYLGPDPYDGTLYGPVGLSSAQPRWHVSQWNIPSPLTANTIDLGGGAWKVTNTYARVQYIPHGKYELAQNGHTTALACGVEYDLFLGANDSSYSSYEQGVIPLEDSPPLSTLSVARLLVGAESVYENIGSRCTVDYAYIPIGIVLVNTSVSPQQTLFYQIVLRDSRGIQSNGSWCPGFTGPSFCVDDGVNMVYSKPALTVGGGRIFYDLDIAARVKALILNGPSGLNKTLAQWRIKNVYYGSGLQGSAAVTTRWDSFAFISY